MRSLIIGVGAAGNKAAIDVIGIDGVTEDDIVLVNSTSKDIPKDFKGMTVVLSPDDSGCGKERSVAKEITLGAIKSGKLDLSKKIEEYDIAVVVASVEGGTGSGGAPIIAKYCEQMLGRNTHLIAFTGFESDVRGLQNTVEFFQEVDDELMVQTIRNKAFLNQAKGVELTAEKMANKELAKRVRMINGSMLTDSDHNIDTTDIYKVVNTAGYMTAEYLEFNEPLMDTSDFDKLCKKMIYDTKSLQSEDPGQSRMAVILNVSPSSEDAVDYSFKLLKQTYGNPYECFLHKQWIEDEPEYIAYICSGMKMPLEEVKVVFEKYKEESSKVNKAQDSFFGSVRELEGNSEDSMFDMGRPSNRSTVSKDDFMKQFQTKPTSKKKG